MTPKSSSKIAVTTAETSSEPPHPRLFEKKRNTGCLSILIGGLAIGCGGSAEAPSTGEIRWKLGDSRTADSLRIVGGSARQLEDGGWLVSWGDNPLVTAFDPSQRIAFRLRLPASTFRAVPVPAGAITVAELDRGLERMEQRR